jgi:small conductance mechanosensitive channel
LASAGVLGIALGFGAQKLINDLVSGIFIISENQYRVGDQVEIEGIAGIVEAITIRTTILRDLSGALHHIPNGSIVVTTNKSMGFGVLNLDITVTTDTDITKLEHIINHVGERLASDPAFKDDIVEAPHFERVTDFTGNGTTVKVLAKTLTGRQLAVKSRFFTDLKVALGEHSIKLAVLAVTGASSGTASKRKR